MFGDRSLLVKSSRFPERVVSTGGGYLDPKSSPSLSSFSGGGSPAAPRSKYFKYEIRRATTGENRNTSMWSSRDLLPCTNLLDLTEDFLKRCRPLVVGWRRLGWGAARRPTSSRVVNHVVRRRFTISAGFYQRAAALELWTTPGPTCDSYATQTPSPCCWCG